VHVGTGAKATAEPMRAAATAERAGMVTRFFSFGADVYRPVASQSRRSKMLAVACPRVVRIHAFSIGPSFSPPHFVFLPRVFFRRDASPPETFASFLNKAMQAAALSRLLRGRLTVRLGLALLLIALAPHVARSRSPPVAPPQQHRPSFAHGTRATLGRPAQTPKTTQSRRFVGLLTVPGAAHSAENGNILPIAGSFLFGNALARVPQPVQRLAAAPAKPEPEKATDTDKRSLFRCANDRTMHCRSSSAIHYHTCMINVPVLQLT